MAIKNSIGEKVPTFIMTLSMLFGGFFVGFLRGWLMALVGTAALPFLAFGGGIFAYVLQNVASKTAEAYQQAGGKAE